MGECVRGPFEGPLLESPRLCRGVKKGVSVELFCAKLIIEMTADIENQSTLTPFF